MAKLKEMINVFSYTELSFVCIFVQFGLSFWWKCSAKTKSIRQNIWHLGLIIFLLEFIILNCFLLLFLIPAGHRYSFHVVFLLLIFPNESVWCLPTLSFPPPLQTKQNKTKATSTTTTVVIVIIIIVSTVTQPKIPLIIQ